MRIASLLLVIMMICCVGAKAQQFDNFDGTDTFDGFDVNANNIEAADPLFPEGGGLLLEGSGAGIQLNLEDSPQGSFQEFPGVTGPVTSVSQPETGQGSTISLRALDRLLGQPTDIELFIGQTVVFGRVAIRAIECRYPASDPGGDAYAQLEILDLRGNPLFDGWMIASSPALNALEHSRYDVWVLQCNG